MDYIHTGDMGAYSNTDAQDMSFQLYMLADFELIIAFKTEKSPFMTKTVIKGSIMLY